MREQGDEERDQKVREAFTSGEAEDEEDEWDEDELDEATILKRGQTKIGTSRSVLIHLPLEMLQQRERPAFALALLS